MSVLAKVFVIIVLVFSIAMLSVTAALYHHRVNWREQFEKLQIEYMKLKEIDDSRITYLENALKDKDAELEKMHNRMLQLTSYVEDLKKEARNKSTQLIIETQEMALLLRDHARLVAILETKDNRITLLESENHTLKNTNATLMARKNTAENQVVRLSRMKLYLEKSLRDLREEFTKVRRELDEKTMALEHLITLGVPVWELVTLSPPPKIDGQVLASDEETKLVVLSVGMEQGVKIGYQFTIFRGTRFIARVIVEKVWKDACGARVIFSVDKIEKLDSASTRLP
ncbi:MAG: hypothetical protein N2234_04295 [Planctomycetota bacterium]|nr:hypothetical protein [Planctomycetota bacterium]